jgi:hypothetical protein
VATYETREAIYDAAMENIAERRAANNTLKSNVIKALENGNQRGIWYRGRRVGSATTDPSGEDNREGGKAVSSEGTVNASDA